MGYQFSQTKVIDVSASVLERLNGSDQHSMIPNDAYTAFLYPKPVFCLRYQSRRVLYGWCLPNTPPPCSLGIQRSFYRVISQFSFIMQQLFLCMLTNRGRSRKVLVRVAKGWLTPSTFEENRLEQAIRLATKRGFHMINNSSKTRGLMNGGNGVDSTGGEWEAWRRVWRSLVFLDG